MLYVFSGSDQLSEDFIRTCSSFLPKRRLDQMMRYHFLHDRKLCALTYLLLVHALKTEGYFYSLPEFGYCTDGKPFLSNYPDIHFNLSHCQDVAVCLISEVEVGVDVEKVDQYDDKMARAICNDVEYLWVTRSSDPKTRAKSFTKLWTRKESVVKWRGTGLNCDPREIILDCSTESSSAGFQITSHYVEDGDFYISVCRERK